MLSGEDYNILRLFRSKNVGSHTFFKLLNYFGDAETAINNIDEFNRKGHLKNPIVIASKEIIEKEMVGCSTVGAKIITYKNPKYPKMLLEISDFPPVLTVLGNVDLLNKKSISIVGARNASSNGCNFAKKISKELSENGYVITSGFATGIDTFAHRGAVANGTIAVLGGGVDNIYPRGNEELYYEIKNKGLIISEVPFNSEPRAESFPARNRIVSGLSEGVVIIEAGARSGTIHTARQAIDQGRELFVVPGNPYDYRAEGSNKLLKEGATVITSAEDVLENLANFDLNTIRQNKDSMLFDSAKTFVDEIVEEPLEIEEAKNDEPADLAELILLKLNYTPIAVDLLCEDLGIDINILNVELIKLELDGKIVIVNGCAALK